MSYDNNNVFARILRGELPCQKLYEDDATFAFLDIMPQSDGHSLVLPKEPAAVLADLSPAALQATMLTTQKLARAVQQATGAPGLRIAQFNGAVAGQTVPHVHFHIIPCYPQQELRAHARESADPAALAAMREKVVAALAALG
ncbi:HIT family protein [Azoarcus olearius]|uniref:Probable HIT family protein n=1 Tax=Azoarcus sp. (strain BH72) TaxID=418699 RepID=A1K5L1_AZOSB|nr:HIT family protein [Azoarcus olearius]CAL94116.1 probable HIT family protein [Azoarcus olearius]